tara:strand:- start:379 stop:546 length:168 start_codon:yes stop_codon:yes gene_type:complete
MMINIQNNKIQKKINFLFLETIALPISFIVTTSFVTGSLTGSVLVLGFRKDRENL